MNQEPNEGEEMEVQTNGHGQIFGLMAAVLKEVGAIAKGRRNDQQGYRFRGIDDVYDAVHPLFAKHGIFTIPRVLKEETSERTTQSGTVLRFVNLTMAYDFFAPDGSKVTAEMIGEAMDAGDKASNKAMSAAQKYALLQTFCIPTGSTPDADFTTHEDLQPGTNRVSKSNTADEKCPKCEGAMWDNRESKRNPKAPDYKCKDRSCDGAVWSKASDEDRPTPPPRKRVDETKGVLIKSVADAFKLLNDLGYQPQWTKKTANEYVSVHFQGAAGVDQIEEDQLNDLLRMLSEKIDLLKQGAGEDRERADIIAAIRSNFDSDAHLENYVKEHNYESAKLEELTTAQLETIRADVDLPF